MINCKLGYSFCFLCWFSSPEQQKRDVLQQKKKLLFTGLNQSSGFPLTDLGYFSKLNIKNTKLN